MNTLNSKDLLQNIIDLLPMRIFWKDKNSKYLGCNLAFAEDIDKTPNEIVGLDDTQMPWSKEAEKLREIDLSVMSSGEAVLGLEEYRIVKNGDKGWFRIDKFPLKNKTGEVIGILITYDDRTNEKNYEETIKAKLEEIEKINKLMVGRELKMIELKDEIEKLKNANY